MAKAQPAKQTAATAAGEGSQAPVADVASDLAPASAGGQDEEPEAPVIVAADPAPPVASSVVTVRLLLATTIAGVAYAADDVLEGLPETLAQAHVGEVDPHPDAVAHALSIGSPVKQFTQPEAAE